MNPRPLFIAMSSIVLVAFLSLTVLIFYWLNYPYQPLTFKDDDFPLVNTHVKRGETLTYISNYCKNTDESALVNRTFVDGVLFVTPPTSTGRPRGCHVISVEVPIPNKIPPGEYYLENTYTYHPNPIRTIIIKKKTEKFIIE